MAASGSVSSENSLSGSSSSTIAIDSSYSQELVEFWASKYQKAKAEIEELKQKASENERDALQELVLNLKQETNKRKATDAELRTLVSELRKANSPPPPVTKREAPPDNELPEKLLRAESLNEDLSMKLAASEQQNAGLHEQIQVFYAQSVALAAEADVWRRDTVNKMIKPVNFLPELDERGQPFQSCPVTFAHPQLVIDALPPAITDTHRLYFLPRPPTCMPLRVPSCGKHGYWFYPAWMLPEDAEFELIVEGRPSEWTYLGRYRSIALPGGEMKLSEWMALDEETKMGHCMRVSQQSAEQGSTANMGDQLDIKRRYEIGQWSVPCFALRCVGFSLTIYKALQAASESATISSLVSASTKRKPSTSEEAKRKKSRVISGAKT